MKLRKTRLLRFSLLALIGLMPGCQSGVTTALSNNTANSSNVPAHATPTPTDDAPRISLADAKVAFDSGSTIFVDTRAEAAYKAEHIKGAINISQDKLEANLGKLSKDKRIIAYCS